MAGTPPSGHFTVPDGILDYVRSLLRNDLPLRPEIDGDRWADFLPAFRSHWIIPLLYRRIGSLPAELRPPGWVVDEMREAFLDSRTRCLKMERQIGEMGEAFRDSGVRALILRGPALAWSVYPDPALRPASDIDLLVHPEQVPLARETLKGLGYRCLSQRFEVAADFFREEDFIHRDNPRGHLPVDLHWTQWELHPFFESRRGSGVESLFSRAVKITLSNAEYETLHPLDALVQSAIHLALVHRQEMRLIWIQDIALLCRQLEGPDDWEELKKRSVDWRARRATESSLKMAEHWSGLEIPEAMGDFSHWPRPAKDELVIWSTMTKYDWTSLLLKRSMARPFKVKAMIRSLLHLLFPPADIVRQCYPPSREWLLPLSYGRRLGHWFKKLALNRIPAIHRG